MELHQRSFRSKVVQSLDPEFNDVFEFLVDRDQAADPEAQLRCEVRDIRGFDDVKVHNCIMQGSIVMCAVLLGT